MKICIMLPVAVLSVFIFSCTTGTVQKTAQIDTVQKDNDAFLAAQPDNSDELFRVVMMSDAYETSQKSSADTIMRSEDKNGDKYMCEELNKFNKINEAREAVLSVSLYPDTGRIMKIRPKRLAALREIDELVVEDLQRWNFVSPKKRQISPLKFDVRYRIVLRKKQSDDEIIKEVREKMKEKASQ